MRQFNLLDALFIWLLFIGSLASVCLLGWFIYWCAKAI